MAGGTQDQGETGQESISYVKEALKSQYNWIGIAGIATFALLSGSVLPLLLGAGLELMYLSAVPQNPRFQRLVRSRKYLDERRRLEARLGQMALTLPPDMRKRYENLQAVSAGIRSNYAQLSATSQIFVRQMEEKLDGLLQGFLRLLAAAWQHSEYLKMTSPESIKSEMAQLEKGIAGEPPKVQEINRRRIEILQKRLEKFGKIRENYQVIIAQCAATEDVLALIRDQSVSMKDPQQVSEQLGSLVRDVEQTEDTVKEMEAIFEMGGPDMHLSSDLEPDSARANPASRKPIRG